MLDENTIALFYYSGYGFQYMGKNYLVPTVVNVSPFVLPFENVGDNLLEVEYIFDKMKSTKAKMNIVILDAFYPNSLQNVFLVRELGLAEQLPADSGIILSSSKNDGMGYDSLFRKHFLSFIIKPNFGVEQVFNNVRKSVIEESSLEQIPQWKTNLIEKNFYFVKENNYASIDRNLYHD